MDTPVVYKEEADRVPPGYRERQSRKPAPPQQHLCPAASAGYQRRQPARTEGQGHSCPVTATTWATYVAGREAWWTPEGSVSLEPPGEFWFRLIQSLLHGLWKVLWTWSLLVKFWFCLIQSLLSGLWKVLWAVTPFNSEFEIIFLRKQLYSSRTKCIELTQIRLSETNSIVQMNKY